MFQNNINLFVEWVEKREEGFEKPFLQEAENYFSKIAETINPFNKRFIKPTIIQ